MRFSFLPAAFGNWRPPVAPSFVARRKIGEKGVPRGCGPLNPRGNVLGHSDVLCANHFAMVRVTRLRRLRCREANTLGVRSAYPLASACCAPKARLQHRRRKCPWGTLPWKIEALSQPPAFRLQIRPVILSVPTFSPQLEQYNRVRGNSVLAHATDGPKSR